MRLEKAEDPSVVLNRQHDDRELYRSIGNVGFMAKAHATVIDNRSTRPAAAPLIATWANHRRRLLLK